MPIGTRYISIEYKDRKGVPHRIAGMMDGAEQNELQKRIYEEHGFDCDLVTRGDEDGTEGI